MTSSPRAFVLRHTTLRSVPGAESIRLQLADEVLPLWYALQVETGDPDTSLPYWAFAWSGGLALARYVQERPAVVHGRRVLDIASGSGLCAIVAAKAGAAQVTAVDIDPYATAACMGNARANGVRIDTATRDPLEREPPDVDLILAGDCWYEAALAARVLPWLRHARTLGIDVLVGDPGRRHLPVDALDELACYDVRTTTELEDLDHKEGRVYAVRVPGPVPASAARP